MRDCGKTKKMKAIESVLDFVSLFEDKVMPTYDYRCPKCGHEFEVFQAMTAGVLKKCPQCGQLSLKRLIGPGAAVLFKGSGFYTTDYRSQSYQKQAKAETDKQDSKTEKSKTEQTGSTEKVAKKGAGPSKHEKKTG